MPFSSRTFEQSYNIPGNRQYYFVTSSSNGRTHTRTTFKTFEPADMRYFSSWFAGRSDPIYTTQSSRPANTRTTSRADEYVTREPQNNRRGERHVHFDYSPDYSRDYSYTRDYGRTRPSSPVSERRTQPGRRYEMRTPQGEQRPASFERQRAAYSYTPARDERPRRERPAPPRPNIEVREPRVVHDGLRGISRAAGEALRRGRPRFFYF